MIVRSTVCRSRSDPIVSTPSRRRLSCRGPATCSMGLSLRSSHRRPSGKVPVCDRLNVMAVRIFLVDDHEVVRRGVRDMLEAEDDFEVVGEAGSVEEALARAGAVAPDVAVLDVRLPDGSG